MIRKVRERDKTNPCALENILDEMQPEVLKFCNISGQKRNPEFESSFHRFKSGSLLGSCMTCSQYILCFQLGPFEMAHAIMLVQISNFPCQKGLQAFLSGLSLSILVTLITGP